MGTRGLIHFIYNGKHYVRYNGCDSYWTACGYEVFRLLCKLGYEQLREFFKNIKIEIAEYSKYFDNLEEDLRKGVWEVAECYSKLDIYPKYDGCWIEYIYHIDLDKETFTIDEYGEKYELHICDYKDVGKYEDEYESKYYQIWLFASWLFASWLCVCRFK